MADPESSLKNALCTVAIHADSVWWPVANDSYRLANFNLWHNVLRTQGTPENPSDRHYLPRCPRKEESSQDPEDWLKGLSWWTPEASNLRVRGTVVSRGLLSAENLWYDTEEMKLYRRIWSESVKKIWEDTKPDSDLTCRWRRDVPSGVNASIADFCPSVLQSRSAHMPPTYPSINEQAYQSELFPYHQHNFQQQQQNQHQWHLTNTPMAVYQPNQDPYGDWRNRQAAMAGLLMLQRTTVQRNQRMKRQQSNQPQVLLSSDFPELPNVERRGAEMPDLRDLVPTVYPQTAEDFSTVATLAGRVEEVARRIIYGPPEQQSQAEVQHMLLQNAQEGRRLYRDVLAAKQEDDSYTNMEVKFEELEREALEQYNDSQNDIEVSPELDICPEVEEKFLDLERQAMEQYDDQTEIDEELAGERTQRQVIKEASAQFADGPRSSSPEREIHCYSEVLQSQDEISCSLVVVQDQHEEPFSNPPELLQPKNPEYERPKASQPGPREPKSKECKKPYQATPRVRIPQSLGSSERCEKRHEAKAARTFRPSTSRQERSRKYEVLPKTTYLKQKESSPELGAVRMKKCPPVTVVDKEVRVLANRLKATALNYLKGMDMKMLTEEHSKVALRELLYEKQQNETIRKEVKVVDIQDTDMLRLYAKEIAGLARHQMQLILKRIRKEVVEMPSRRTIFVAQPTTAEKRKVRYFINKSLELMEKAESLKKMPKKPLESSKREISDTLTTIHKTMEVVYQLRDMCRKTYEDMETLMSCRLTLVELLMGQSFLEDKSEYIRRKVQEEKLSLLLYCLFPRRQSNLLDRSWRLLEDRPDAICVLPIQQCINDTLLINHHLEQFEPIGMKRVRLMNSLLVDRPRRKDLWDEGSWQKVLVVGSHSRSVEIVAAGPVPVLELLGLGASRSFCNSEFLPEKRTDNESDSEDKRHDLEQRCKAEALKSPSKRKAGTKSDPEMLTMQPTFGTERSYGTWPNTSRTSNLIRLTQPKQRKKAVAKNDGGCSVM